MSKELVTMVCIEEAVSQKFEVIHADGEGPLEIAAAKYRADEFVLCPGEVSCKKMAVIHPCERRTEWQEG